MPDELIPYWDQLPDLTWHEKVAYLAHQFLKLPQTPCPLTHILQPGVYIREMFLPAGTLFLGRAHRYGHECRLVSGSVIHITAEGKQMISAPFTMHTVPGYHMVLYAMTDAVGRTIHPNSADSHDTQLMEDEIFESADELKVLGAQIEKRLELQ